MKEEDVKLRLEMNMKGTRRIEGDEMLRDIAPRDAFRHAETCKAIDAMTPNSDLSISRIASARPNRASWKLQCVKHRRKGSRKSQRSRSKTNFRPGHGKADVLYGSSLISIDIPCVADRV